MASAEYIVGRKRYSRPQAMLWSDNPGTLTESGLYVPTGSEVGANPTNSTDIDAFLVLSDHGRGPISMVPERIEKRERMINGRMRSYHIADKLKIDLSWEMLPSRSYSGNPNFAVSGLTSGTSTMKNTNGEYTVDGGAGGVELLDWYENHKGPFWVFLAYDKYNNFTTTNEVSKYSHLLQYNQIVEVYFSKFDYSVVKRGQPFVSGYDVDENDETDYSKPIRSGGHDFWNVSVSLEEV
jgi:hypothetical protein